MQSVKMLGWVFQCKHRKAYNKSEYMKTCFARCSGIFGLSAPGFASLHCDKSTCTCARL